MWGGFGFGLPFLQVGLVASWALRAEHSTANWSAGLDHHTPSPAAWNTHLTVPPASGAGTAGEREPPSCTGEEDCPPWSTCEEDQAGRNSCHCGLGYHLSPTFGCVPVRVFPAQLGLQDSGVPGWSSEEPQLLSWIDTQIQILFQHILGHLDGYLGSSTRHLKWPSAEVMVLHHFSSWVPVTAQQVKKAVAAFWVQCQQSDQAGIPACVLLRPVASYQSLSLCQFDLCNAVSTTCSFEDGLVRCSCRLGYFQAHAADRTCTACGSGFWLQNSTCGRCPFGFSGAGCQEPFLLALVVVSCTAGFLLVLLLLLTVVSLSRKARTPKEGFKGSPDPPQLPLHSSSTLSLPRVRPPWTTEEGEMGGQPHLSLWDLDVGRRPADAPQMKTFLGSPQPLEGRINPAFANDAEPWGKRSYF